MTNLTFIDHSPRGFQNEIKLWAFNDDNVYKEFARRMDVGEVGTWVEISEERAKRLFYHVRCQPQLDYCNSIPFGPDWETIKKLLCENTQNKYDTDYKSLNN